MFQHVKDLQFDARVSAPDPRFANLLLEQFGGANGELKAAMQYFVQGFACRRSHPDKYDLLMDIATEEFSHLEIVGATITMLLDGISGQLKQAAEGNLVAQLGSKSVKKKDIIGMAMDNPHFLTLTGGGPEVTDSRGIPWNGQYVNANGELTVDLRSNIAAESRAKIVYEYLLQFTDDPHVQDTLRFLMTREIAHFQQFSTALATIEPNFPPGILQGDPRFTHTYFNMSDGKEVRGPWNEGSGPWPQEEHWEYVDDPVAQVRETQGQTTKEATGNAREEQQLEQLERTLADVRSTPFRHLPGQELSWSENGGPSSSTRGSKRS